MSKHTPGEWRVIGKTIRYFENGDSTTPGGWVALPMTLANALLIEAAPDLLAMMKRLSTISTMDHGWDKEILALIAKAEGRE